MKYHFKALLITLMALTVTCVYSTAYSFEAVDTKTPGAAAQSQGEEDLGYSEEEYDAYDTAAKEPDSQKRTTKLMQFIEKYPKSKLMPYIDGAFKTLMFDSSSAKDWAALEFAAEQWLKIHPNDIDAMGSIVTAAKNLDQSEKYLQTLLEIYKLKPSAGLAVGILDAYGKAHNREKYLEWTEIVFKYPEYDGNFQLRFVLVKMFADSDLAKAAQYAKSTLKSIEAVKEPSAEIAKEMREDKRECYEIIGADLMQKDKFAEAIASFEKALAIKETGADYYNIAYCQRKLDQTDEAMISYAKAELLGDKIAPKAKENLEQIYRAIHNDTLIGIEKIYKKAKKQDETAEVTN